MRGARGHLEVLKWARENGCPWTADRTCAEAAEGGHVEVEVGARERLPVDKLTCTKVASAATEVLSGRGKRLPAGLGTRRSRRRAATRGAEVGARERLPGQVDVHVRGEVLKWARERLPVGR